MGCQAGWSAGIGALLAMAMLAPPAGAMAFARVGAEGVTVVRATGEITLGDAERFTTELMLAPRGVPVVLRVDSQGGSVVAGEALASVVSRHRVAVAVGPGDTCASACFLLFAASPARMAARTARVGVHSASSAAGETMASMATTTVMARSAADMGVPVAIVGRMVAAGPGAMAWLSAAELASLGTHVLDGPAPTAAPAAIAAPRGPALPAVTAILPRRNPARPPPRRVNRCNSATPKACVP